MLFFYLPQPLKFLTSPPYFPSRWSLKRSRHETGTHCHSISDGTRGAAWKTLDFSSKVTNCTCFSSQLNPMSPQAFSSSVGKAKINSAGMGILSLPCRWLLKPTGTAWLHPPLVTEPYRRQQPPMRASCATPEQHASSKAFRMPHRARQHHSSWGKNSKKQLILFQRRRKRQQK